MDKQEEKPLNIQSLPYDIILLVLDYSSPDDIIRFGNTCKQFNELVKNSQGLWKVKLRTTVNEAVYREIEKSSDANWYNKLSNYMNLQSEVHDRINDMAVYYYKCKNEITLYDVRMFLNNPFSNGLEYYCTINILQELLMKGNKNIIMGIAKPPYTLTEMHYSKVVVRHLIHACLAIKWVQEHMGMGNDMPPEIVLNYFLQWVDPLRMHTDEQVNDAINSLTSLVEVELKKIQPKCTIPIQEMCASGKITDAQIIAAVSHVLYKEKRLTPLSVANLETLDIMKVLEMHCGHDVVIAAIFRAVAKKFGVNCELVAFPNHLFLELRGLRDSDPVYKIELDSGKLSPKRTCPFSRNNDAPNSYKYCPDSLLQFLISSFLLPLGSYKTWYMQNALYLMEFLTTNPSSDNKYKNYLPYLLDHTHLPALSMPIDVRCMTDEHLKIIALLSYLAKSSAPPPERKEVAVNRRSGDVKYAVGMIVQHRVYEYTSVVCGWEAACRADAAARRDAAALPAGARQPFYSVVAVDQSDRYIAQEHLMEVPRPSRLYHLEDLISKEFTHYNGYAYEPNSLKRAEYPDDQAVSEQYRARAAALYGLDHN